MTDSTNIVRGSLAADAKVATTAAGSYAVRVTLNAPKGSSRVVAQYAYRAGRDAAQKAADALKKGSVVQIAHDSLRIASTGKAIVAAGVSSILCGCTDVVRFDTAPKAARKVKRAKASAA